MSDVNRREVLKYMGVSLLLLVSPIGKAAIRRSLVAARVWPADEYTRITLEAPFEIQYKYMLLTDPDRLVVDLENVELDKVVSSLSTKVNNNDPYVKLIRAGINRPGVVRVVIELKKSIKPQVFTIKPVASYGNRLVLDLYPKVTSNDPLMALLEKKTPLEKATGSAEKNPQIASSKNNQLPKSNQNRMITIVLDPGHGGEDPGASGSFSHEKHIVLSIADRLRRKIDAQPNMRVALTRKTDHFIPLRRRVEIARKLKGDLFVSIHADGFIRKDARGSGVFMLAEKGASSKAADWLAQNQNDADKIGGVSLTEQVDSLKQTLIDLSQTATLNDSHKVGGCVLKRLGKVNHLHKNYVEQAGFAVLRAPDIPSVLVETAFITNPEEEKKLNDPNHQDKIAQAILLGIQDYFKTHPPLSPHSLAQKDFVKAEKT